jgi:hypothetical protein
MSSNGFNFWFRQRQRDSRPSWAWVPQDVMRIPEESIQPRTRFR